MGKKSKRRGQQSQAGPCCSEACCDYGVDKDVLVACQKIFECKYRYFQKYRKVPKVTSPLVSHLTAFSYRYFWRVATLISRGCYFWVTKTCTIHGPYEVTVIMAQQM